MCQAANQLQWVRDTLTHYNDEIAEVKWLLKERESSGSLTDATPVKDVEMENIEDDPNLPPDTVTETDPTTEEAEDQLVVAGGIDLTTPGGDQPIMEGGITPFTPEDDKFLEDEDEEEDQPGSVTPSGVVAESLSMMKMDSLAPPDGDPPPSCGQDA